MRIGQTLPVMLPPSLIALGPPAEAVLRLVLQAVPAARRRWQFWRKRSPEFTEALLLYFEVVYNLLVCRRAQAVHPPEFLMTRAEWSRPSTPALLAGLLDTGEAALVAFPYIEYDVYHRTFEKPWLELLPLRLTGGDVQILAQLGDHLAGAEQVLRRRLYPAKTQTALAEAIAEALGEPPAKPGLPSRLNNAFWATPASWKWVLALGLLGWRGSQLLPQVRRSLRRTF